jgi:hypothetical protein
VAASQREAAFPWLQAATAATHPRCRILQLPAQPSSAIAASICNIAAAHLRAQIYTCGNFNPSKFEGKRQMQSTIRRL